MKLAINPKVIDRHEGKDKRLLATGFENYDDISPTELAGLIKRGIAFCPQVKDGHRNSDNFICSDYIAVDIDQGWKVEEALAEEFVKTQASIFYTTASHTPEAHRFRIIFQLPRTITDPEEMHHAMAGIGRKFRGDLATKDAARLFFGSSKSKPIVFGNILEEKYLTEIIELGKGEKNFTDNTAKKTKVRASMRSTLTVDPDWLIHSRNGDHLPLKQYRPETSVYCPFHLDQHPSAFTVENRARDPGIHCSTCQRTFWITNARREKYDFYFFDDAFKGERDAELAADPDIEIDEWLQEQVQRSYIAIDEAKLAARPLEPGLTFIKSPKNTGKTSFLETVVEACKYGKLSVLLIGHRQSLLQANAKRLGLTCYLDLPTGSSGNRAPGRELAISVDSLRTILQPTRHQFDVVLIDESEQVIAHLIAQTLKENSRDCYLLLKHYIGKAKSVIALDADMNRITVEAILDCLDDEWNNKFRLVLNEYKETGKRLYLYDSENHLYSEVMRAVKSGKRCFICCNSKRKVEELSGEIAKETNHSIPMLWITADNAKTEENIHFLQNIKTEILNYKVIIVSPVLGTGIDITFQNEAQEIDCVFGFFGARINTHYDIDQQLYRVRHPKEIRVWISPQTFLFETNRNVLKRELALSRTIPGVVKGYDKVSGEQIVDMEDPYLDLYANITAAQRASKNELRHHFIDLREKNGWEIVDVPTDDEQAEEGKEIKKRAKVTRQDKVIEEILAAPPFEKKAYLELLRKLDSNLELSIEEQIRLKRWWLESFYQEPVTRDLILMDDEGKLRKQISHMDYLLSDKREKGKQLREALRTGQEKKPYNEPHVIGMLLEKAGIYNVKQQKFLDRSVITEQSLSEFVKTCRARRTKAMVERVLDIEMRRDVVRDPVSQLKAILKLIGLKTAYADTIRGSGSPVNQYQLDEDAYHRMVALVETHRRRGKNPKKVKSA